MSTRGQQGYLHYLGRVIERDTERGKQLIYGYCVQWYGEDPSTKALSYEQAKDMRQRLEAIIQADPEISNDRQRKKIAKYGYLLNWKSKSIRKFLRHQTCGYVNDWNHLTFEEANKVLNGMEKIIKSDGKGHLLYNRSNGRKSNTETPQKRKK